MGDVRGVDLHHAAAGRIERDGDRQVLVLDDGRTVVRIALPAVHEDVALTRLARRIKHLAAEVRSNGIAGYHGPLNGP